MPRLILLPGLGADRRMFSRLGPVGTPLEVESLLLPHKGEGMEAYAARTAKALRIGEDDLIGGGSFGGMVASAIARGRPVGALILIGSAITSDAVRRPPIPGLERLLSALPPRLIEGFLRSEGLLKRVFGPEEEECLELGRVMLRDTPSKLLLEGMRLVSTYRPAGPPSCPVFAIHGRLDRVMSPPAVPGCRVIEGAGHGIAFTHAGEVTAFLQEICRQFPHLSQKGNQTER